MPSSNYESSNKSRKTPLALTWITVLCLFFLTASSLKPSKPIEVNPNTQSSPSNFIFHFELSEELQSDGYLMISFSPLISTATPSSCLIVDSSSTLAVSQCVNLDAASTAGSITVNKTWIGEINPNIDATKTIVLQFNQNLAINTEYSLQIITNNVLPAIGSITDNFEFYTISSTGFMIEENWNFGQVYFEYRQNNILDVNSINDLTQNEPGSTTSNLEFEITIGIQSPTAYSRLKFTISDSFQFSQSSLVNIEGVLSTAPQDISTEIISPNVILTTFNESFAPGRKFKVSITDISNPLTISTGFVSVYYLPDNSMSPLEIKELSIPIGTIQYQPTISILTGEGIATMTPIQFYQQKEHYVTVRIILPRQFNDNFVLQLLTDTLTIHEGSVYAITSTTLAATLSYDHYTALGVRISGFGAIPSGSQIDITMKVWVPNTPSFNVFVSMDELANLGSPIIYGSSPTAVNTIVAENFVTLLTGSQNEPNKVSKMSGTTSSLSFTVTPTFTTQTGSSFRLYTCENMIKGTGWSDSASCLVGGVAKTCTLATNSTLSVLTIASGSSFNLFVANVATTIVINNLDFKYASSNTNYIYQFYFQITASESTTSPVIKSTVETPQVIPERNLMTGFENYFSNDIYNTGSNYPNIFRVVSTTPTEWNYVIQSTEKRMFSIFCKEGWTDFFTTLTSGSSYPHLSTIDGITVTYIKGTTNNLTEEFPLNWDKIDVVLPGGENSTSFSIALPMTFITDTTFYYEIMAGIYNTETRLITYTNIEPRPQAGSPTYKNFPSTVAISSKPIQATTKIQLSGKAGSYEDSIELKVNPAAATFMGTTYSSALIITSTWAWFDSTSSYNTGSISSSNPLFSTDEQKPLSLQLSSESFLTYIPFKTTGAGIGTDFSVLFDQIKNPYTHDLPYYSVVLVDETGTVDSYNEFINQDQGVFYDTYLKAIAFSCSDNSLGVSNTDCSLAFTPNQQLEVAGKIYVQLTGLTVSTNKCVLTLDSDGSSIPITCSSNTDKNQVVVTLGNSQRLTALVGYTLKIYGMSITESTIIHYSSMTIRDPSGGYIIERGTRILMTSVSSYFPIYINQMTYLKNNPIVVSGFDIVFQIPRTLNQDEVFALVMGNDLSNLNNIPSKLRIKLYNNITGVQIPNVRWFLNSKNFQIVFEGLHDVLTVTTYKLEIFGIKTPSSIDQDIVSLIYLRTFDSSYTVQNIESSTADFPALVSKVNSLITFQSYFNTEGMQQPLQFTITGQNADVDAATVWYITLPRYYSQQIWNENYLAYCRIDSIALPCAKHPDIPYTIMIHSSPKEIDIGTTYKIEVFGLTCPKKDYLNGNPQYVTESIFFGMAENSTAESYVEYSELFMTETVISPQDFAGYGTITSTAITNSNTETFQTTFLSLQLMCSVQVNPGEFLFITFPSGFDNFNDISMEGDMIFGLLSESFTASVANTRLSIEVPSGITVTANSAFRIQLSSLPTPKSAVQLDMNKIKVVLTNSDKILTKAASLQLHNQVSSLSFDSSELHIVINEYNPIEITAGTYSDPIKVRASDSNTFVSNMQIQFISTSVTFVPNPAFLLLGNLESQFQIGVQQSLIPTIYTYEIIKSETSISAFYTALSRYSVKVTNSPIVITIPTMVEIPYGGCSVPFEISLSNAPFSDLSLNFEYDSASYTMDQFWINEEVSFNELTFSKSITSRQLSFCTSTDFSVTTFDINLFLGGTNQDSYSLSSSTLTINMISNETTNESPTLSLTTTNVQKTYASFNVTTNLNGYVFYEMALAPLSTPLELLDLKFEIKQNNLTLEAQSEYVSKQIYTADRDHRLGFMAVSSGANQLVFENLLAERTYTLCAYFENQHRVITGRVCENTTTQTWGIIKKFSITFTSTIFESQLNDALCFFSRASNSEISQVVDLQGKSCSLSSSPSNYNYAYNGSTITNELSSTILYHISDMNLTTDPSSSTFTNLYDSSGISSATLLVALSNFSIDYISTSNSLGEFNPIDAINIASTDFEPTLTFTAEQYVASSYSLYLRSIQLSKPGAVYFIVTPYKTIIIDQIAAHADIEIRPLIYPTSEQILNCKDGYDEDPLACKRVVLKEGESLDLEFSSIAESRMYAIFYLVVNEYPLRPIVYGDVKLQEMVTLVNWQTHITSGMVFAVLLVLALLF